MTEWSFRLTIAGLDLTDEELDALFAAGCDDATFSLERDGAVVGVFDRQREAPEDAVFSAIDQVESVGEEVRVLRVTQEDDWLKASEIAPRVGRSRQNINQLISQKRGPGGFPFPVARHGASNPLYSWAEVEAWFENYEPTTVPSHGPKLSPDFLAELNDTLDLRERHRRRAPWRSQLAETSLKCCLGFATQFDRHKVVHGAAGLSPQAEPLPANILTSAFAYQNLEMASGE